MTAEKGNTEEVESPEIHFEPIVQLDKVEVVTLEEQEEELLNLRAKLFRFDKSDPEEPQWKERGTGYVKLLKHKESGFIRLLMRRDKTFKICANHYVQPCTELKPNCGSDKAFVWSTMADYSDEEPHAELLAIRFGNVENAQKFSEKFEEAKEEMKKAMKTYKSKEPSSPNEDSGASEAAASSPVKPSTTTETDPAGGDSSKTDSSSNSETDSVAKGLEKLTVKEKNETESSEKPDEEAASEPPTKSESK